MKIVVCANTSWYLYNFRKNLLIALQQQGHQVAVIAPEDPYTQSVRDLGVAWYPLNMHQMSVNPIKEALVLRQLSDSLRRIRPDVVLSYTTKCNLYLGWLRALFPFRQIATISGLGQGFERDGRLRNLALWGYAAALRQAQKVFFQNAEDLMTLTGPRMLSRTICERLPGSGVDVRTFRPITQPVGSHQPRRFLMFGRLVPRKGYDLFMQAARRIRQEQPETAEFVILGIEDRARRDSARLLQRIRQGHTEGVITYLPATDHVLPVLQNCDVVVLPSYYHEGVPRSLLEALACGKPIITTNWKGCRDTVDQDVNGFLIEPDNLEELDAAIRFFVSASDERLRTMGQASRKKAEAEFDEQHVLKRYLAEVQGAHGRESELLT